MTATFVSDDGVIFEIPGTWQIDDTAHVSRCRSCGAPVVWAKNAVSQKRAPFNPVDERLNVSSSHFATCPDADKWRKR